MKMNVCWQRLLRGQSAAITMETKSDPDQKCRPRSHLSEVSVFFWFVFFSSFFSQQQHLTTLIITRELGCISAERNNKQLLAPRSSFLILKKTAAAYLSDTIIQNGIHFVFSNTRYQLLKAELIKFKCRVFLFGFKKKKKVVILHVGFKTTG